MDRPAARILGIDPGTRNMGWAVVQVSPGGCRALGFGVIKTKAKLPKGPTLKILREALTDLICEYRPEAISMEDVFFSGNVGSAMAVAEARGIVHLVAAEHAISDVSSHTPQNLKIAAAGYGRADKAQVAAGVQARLGLLRPVRPDHAADALAAALRHHDVVQAGG